MDIYADIVLKGRKERKIEKVLIDTGATYSFFPPEIIREIKAIKLPAKVIIELGNGKKIKAETYGAVIKVQNREAPIILASFKGAKMVVGVEALESLGLRVNPKYRKLEEVRPKGMAYFYWILSNKYKTKNLNAKF